MGPLTGTGLGLLDLQQEDDDGQQVGDIPQDAEDVHGAGGAPPGRREQRGEGKGRELFPSGASAEPTLSSSSAVLFAQCGALSSGGEKFRLPSALVTGAFPLPGAQAGRLPCFTFPPSGFSLSSPPGPSSPGSRPKVGACPLASPGLSLLSSPKASAG